MRLLHALAFICGIVAPAVAGQYFNTPVTSTATGTAWSSQAGQFYIAASSANVSSTTANVPTKSTWTITLNGVGGYITASSSISASAFFGDASHLTGTIPAGDIPNTTPSSFTVTGGGGILVTYGVNASTFVGNGAGLTSITAANISAGSLGLSVIASSVAASGVTAGTYGSLGTSHPNITVGVDGRVTSAANTSITGASGQFTVVSTFTVQGNAFSVGGSTLVVSGGIVSVGLSTFTVGSYLNVSGVHASLGGYGTPSNAILTLSKNSAAGFSVSSAPVVMIAAPDQTTNIALTIRQDNNEQSGYNWSIDQNVNGNLYFQGTAGGVNTNLMIFSRTNNTVALPNVTTGAMLCLTSGGSIGHCTSGASCLSTCTCTCTAN